ncbi:hypothetical protein FDP41_013570 [Naegleria fowleri]|uniref:SH3 domain-containing protein n=1 Tax=Naegleria fowleri TaxID=5763 RepID=A0A6A5BYB2_NAEFO|nr:uncharacterized protein FDP41_013570 [Naegleria fowleri]KAF0980356.1 hypothetical protein FDP41_013570 [Naegleria fowleri]CAG4716690.1 unnamed protein product [Naegleria fowleri]
MSKLDLSDAKVKQALDDVTNSKLVYALLKHEGVSNKVIVASTGNGLRDMIDDLNDGTIMYALIRFVINDATKFVYVGWCPEGIANQIFKGKFQNWNKDMEFYLKGRYHLSIYARNEEDIDEEAWIKKLKISAGSSYTQTSNVKDLTVSQAKQNIVTAKTEVKKTEVAINENERNKFWQQEQERLKQQEQEKKNPVTRNDYKKTDERNQFWQQQQSSTSSSGVVKSSDRVNEIQQLRSTSNNYWKQQEEQPSQTETKPKEIIRGNKDLFKKFENLSVQQQEEQPRPKPPISTGATNKKPPMFQPPPQPPRFDDEEEENNTQQQYEEDQSYNQGHQSNAWEEEEQPQQQEQYYEEPQQQHYEEEQPQHYEEEPPQPPPSSSGFSKPAKPKGYMEKQIEQGRISPTEVEELTKPTKLPPPPIPSKPKRKELVALYDFDAQEGELSFREGEILYLVQDEGEWWMAENADGQQGYIPSNYVEMK